MASNLISVPKYCYLTHPLLMKQCLTHFLLRTYVIIILIQPLTSEEGISLMLQVLQMISFLWSLGIQQIEAIRIDNLTIVAKEHRIEEEADIISTIPPIKGKISIKIIKIKVLVALIATVMDTLQRIVLRKGDKGKSTR